MFIVTGGGRRIHFNNILTFLSRISRLRLTSFHIKILYVFLLSFFSELRVQPDVTTCPVFEVHVRVP